MIRFNRRIVAGMIILNGCAGSVRPDSGDAAPAVLTAKGPAPETIEDRSAHLFDDQSSAKRIAPESDPHVTTSREQFALMSGDAPIVVSFDDTPAGTDLEMARIEGVSFLQRAAPLEVIRADQSYSPAGYENLADPGQYRLLATSGEQILSPGGVALAPGPDPAREDDDLTIRFDPPLAAVGFDLLSMSMDGMSFTDVTVIGFDGAVLYSGRIEIPRHDAVATQNPPSGSSFWGYVAESCTIHELRIDEQDSDAKCADANIGFDSIRLAPTRTWHAADLDGDGEVSRVDVQLFMAQWRAWNADATARQRWWRADLNRDRRVDELDFLYLIEVMDHKSSTDAMTQFDRAP